MIAVDTNILVYAHRVDIPEHSAAVGVIRKLAAGRAQWAIPWPCIHEFLAVVTHPRLNKVPSPIGKALAQVDIWRESPSLVLLTESRNHWQELTPLLTGQKVVGPMVHDAKIAAICIEHGVNEIWTADRDFSRFAPLRAFNPIIHRER